MIIQARRRLCRVASFTIAAITLATAGCGQPGTQRFFLTPPEIQPTPAGPRAAAPRYVRVSRDLITPGFIAATGFEQDHVTGETHAFGWINSTSLDFVQNEVLSSSAPSESRAGLQFLDEDALRSVAVDPDTMMTREPVLAKSTGAYPGSNESRDYHDYEELTAELEALAAGSPALARLENAGPSVASRNLWYMKAGARLDAANGGPRTLLIANMHGDETAGRELMIYLLRDLLGGYNRDERITRIMNGSQVFVMPSMNPDGFEDRQRWNGDYKDLNRSFPDFTDDPNDTINGRPPEVAAVMKLHDRYAFANSLNFHGGTVCFNMPWDTKPNRQSSEKFGDDAYMNLLARAYTSSNRTMRDNHGGTFDHGVTYGYEWYEVDGGMQDWSIHYRDTTHATIELSYAKTVSAGNLETVWRENREAILDFLDRSTFGVHLNVVDDASGATLASRVEVTTSNAPRATGFRSGLVHRMTPAGTWQVTVRAAGYVPVTLQVTASSFNGSLQVVRLARAS